MDNNKSASEKNIISFNPDGNFYFKKAVEALQKERFDIAFKYLKRATELSPEDPNILTQYGVLVMEQGDLEEARAIFLKAYTLDNVELETVFYLAEVHAHLGLLNDSRQYAEHYISQDPDGFFAEECSEIIDFVKQKEVLFKEEETESWEVYLLQEKSRSFMESGEFDKAVEVLESIIEQHPEAWAASNNLALAYFYIGKTEKARDILHDVLKRNKGNLHALCNLAIFYYYEQKEDKLAEIISLLLKIKPYVLEHRYKLGATFALVGRNQEAFDWLRSLQKRGFEGDAGFYFWLAQSAYFIGQVGIAKRAYATLIDIDPTKKGYEPWADLEEDISLDTVEQDRDFLLSKIENEYQSERMLGYFLLGKSIHRQEILSHPNYVNINELSEIEKLFLASGFEEDKISRATFSKPFLKSLEVTELLYEQYGPLSSQSTHLFQMWFTLCERALLESYRFFNPAGLAAAADYMFQSSRSSNVTKKAMAEKYGVSPSTLTKYVNDLMEFLPHFDL